MNALLEEIYRTGRVLDGDGNAVDPFPSAVTQERGAPLYSLVRAARGGESLEVGMGYGLSTLFMCQAHRDNGAGRHTAVDPWQESRYRSIGLLNVRRAGLEEHFRFYGAPSHEILPRLLRERERFDVIFIDGNHLVDYALVDFFYADRLLRVGAYLAIDDLWLPAVRKVVAFVLRNAQYELAPEWLGRRAPLWRRLLRLGRAATQSPLDLVAIAVLGRAIAKGFVGQAVLRKRAEDDRRWDHYRSF